MTEQNYYEILGLAPFADGAMVDQAYWHLAKTYQSLAEADPRARQALDDLNEAYAVLGTPRLRDEYDTTLSGSRAQDRRAKAQPAPSGRGFRLRFSLPAWPFGKDSDEPQFEARVRSLGPETAPRADRNKEPAAPPPAAPRQRKGDVLDLHASTARMLERWRQSADAAARASMEPQQSPDMTLVDIFKSEQNLESGDDPLTAVMEILKAPPDRLSSPEKA
jgi:curved DNA-binding protein CbpA